MQFRQEFGQVLSSAEFAAAGVGQLGEKIVVGGTAQQLGIVLVHQKACRRLAAEILAVHVFATALDDQPVFSGNVRFPKGAAFGALLGGGGHGRFGLVGVDGNDVELAILDG